jgi:hypothetical protein
MQGNGCFARCMSLGGFEELEATLVDVFTRDDGSPFIQSRFPI